MIPGERSPLLPLENESKDSAYDQEDGCYSRKRTRATAYSRQFRSMIFVCLVCAALSFCTWKWCLRQQWKDDWKIEQGFLIRTDERYDVAKTHHFDGERVQDLDPALVPGGDGDRKGKRRLVFVGDIHGCARELKALLKKVGFREEKDHLVAVGDVISKGPENVEVLDELMRLNASSVRGNHEDRILALVPAVLDGVELPPDAEPESETFAGDSELLHQLSRHHLDYLQSMPLILRIPPFPRAVETSHKANSLIAEEILVVHAGLVPALSLEKQDPYFVMNMRSIHTKTHHPAVEAESKKAKTKAWHEIWCWYNDRLAKHKSLKDFRVQEDLALSSGSGGDGEPSQQETVGTESKQKYPDPQVVVYGHRSKEGLQIERWTKGLDTGCVKGNKLTALVLDAEGKQEIVQVGCKDYLL